jgi:hypothetical protein
MTAVIGNKIVNNVGTIETTVLESNAFQRYTLLGLSVTNITNIIVYVDILIDGGHYLKDLVIPVGTSLRAVSTGEKLILGYNSKITVKCSVDDAVDVISSYAAIANQALAADLQLYEGYGISLTRDESQDILVGVDLRQFYVKIAADDSNIISVPLTDSIKISGQRNVSTFSDADGNLTIEGPDLSSFLTASTELTITTEDLTSRQVALNGTLTFLGTGTVTTSFDQNGNVIIDSPVVDVSDFVTTGQLATYLTTSDLVPYSLTTDIKFNLDADTKVNQTNEITINDTINFVGIGYISTTLNVNGEVEIRWTGEPTFLKINDFNFTVSADDDVQRAKAVDENIKFIGGNDISTTSDANGDITINTIYDLDPITATIALG